MVKKSIMKNKNIYFFLVLSSIFGGVVAIGGYTVFVNPENQDVHKGAKNPVNFTNYVFDSTDFIVPKGLNFVYAAKSATPSVVHIRTKYPSPSYHDRLEDFDFFDYFEDRLDKNRSPGMGAGSGVIISTDGYIATNNHVVENSDQIEVLLNDNRTYQAKIIGADPDTDLALIKIDEEDLPFINFGDSERVQVGEWVLAIGNPFEFRSTVTAGIVSAKARNINILARGGSATRIEAFIQTDAAVNPGNSGGALVNLKGELIGINTAIASPTGSFAGYSFAVPATLVKKVVWDLKDFGAVQRPLLGIQIRDVSASLAEEKGLNVLKGVYIDKVNVGTAADEAGLERQDVIIAVDGKQVSNVSELQEQVAVNRPGDKIEVTYIRDGKKKTVKATLKNQFMTTEVVKPDNVFKLEGATLETVSDEVKEDLGIGAGVQVKSLDMGKWKEAGIEEGFVILKIDKQPIANTKDLMAALDRARGGGILIEGLYPDGKKAYYGIGW